jgi:hypothetical protein
MNPLLKKTLGALLVIVSIIGLLISVLLLTQVWNLRKPVSDKLQSGLTLLSSTLQTTDEGLNTIEQVVNNAYTSTVSLDDATLTLAQSIHDVSLLADSASTLVGEDLITTITNTQTALASAQASAEVIDNLLTTFASIPLIGIEYNPPVPLNVALGQVFDSLDPLPASLKKIQTDLITSQGNLQDLEEQVTVLNQKLTSITQNLVLAQAVINNYQTEVTQVKTWVQTGKDSLPKWILSISWLLTVIIVWLAASQIGTLLQGIDLLAQKREKPVILDTKA